MKKLLIIILTLLGTAVYAANFPEVYCVSTRPFKYVNQINIFTNKKGTLRISVQYYATDGQNEGNFDSNTLQTITRLNYNEATGLMANGVDKLKFLLDKTSISPSAAERMFEDRGAHTFDFMNLPGHKIEFKRYYRGVMMDYNLRGREGYWTGELMKAFRAGVTNYICGRAEDIKGQRPSIFDRLID